MFNPEQPDITHTVNYHDKIVDWKDWKRKLKNLLRSIDTLEKFVELRFRADESKDEKKYLINSRYP